MKACISDFVVGTRYKRAPARASSIKYLIQTKPHKPAFEGAIEDRDFF
jgi:hypothetical protein